MASLRSAMFAGYNKFDDAKVRIGSWREEIALKELTGVTRLANPRNKTTFNATGIRVLFHADKPGPKDPDTGKSVSVTSFVHPEKVSAMEDKFAHVKPGPRAMRSQQEARAIVEAEEAEWEVVKAKKKEEGDFDTTCRQSYKRYSDDASRAAKQAIIKPKLMRDELDQMATSTAYETDKNTNVAQTNVGTEQIGHYSTGTTVTLWNTGGMAPGGNAASHSFGRTTRFTEPGVHPSFFQEVWPDPGPHHAWLPRGLSDREAERLMFLKRRVIERAREQPLPSVRGLWHLLWPRTYRDAVGNIGQREFREGMAEFAVPVTQCEVWAVTTAFNADNSGQISLDKLIQFFRDGGLCEGRRRIVRDLFRKLDTSNKGSVALGRVQETCNFHGSPAVMNGKAHEKELTEAFLQHLHPIDERSVLLFDAEVLVNVERLQEAFRDIGTACITPDSCVWKATAPQQNSSSKDREIDHASDKAHDLFMGVVAAIG
ncbi:unnamed protein product [Scytosiphon promiscuus]